MSDPLKSNLRAIVDIGSNGIRFSISSVDPSRARIFPCLFQDRAAISLFDSLHSSPPSLLESNDEDNSVEVSASSSAIGSTLTAAAAASDITAPPSVTIKNNISPATITQVKNALIRFKNICHDFGVPDSNVRVIATEATREAPNSVQFRQELKEATDWEVLLLSKQEEGRTGAYGVASSFFEIQGLFMDIGGGSVQLSWISCKDGDFQMSETPVSLPYGAAALTRRLQRESRDFVGKEIKENLSSALERIQIPEFLTESASKTGGFKLYVCGGGFRGLGHLLLSTNKLNPYPLPIINGFSCTGKDISNLVSMNASRDSFISSTSSGSNKVFRISERRANQLPAVALLVSQAFEVLPNIRKVLFSQGGVREGALFHDLPSSIRSQDPLIVGTSPYAPTLANRYLEVLQGGFTASTPFVIRDRISKALINVSFIHSSYPKELQPNAGLNICVTGIVSGVHGLSHEVRALLGLALCQRWGGELPDRSLKDSLISITSANKLAWWALYIGHLMHVIGGVYPGGNVRDKIMSLETENVTEKGFTLILNAVSDDVRTNAIMVRGRINGLEKKLKKLSKDLGSSNSLKVNVIVNWTNKS